ncbi:aminoacyl-histidine dipeptidase [Clostridium butyricum]|uniref:Cytosol non-specific dipeptidase n=1 Tax=Clostridium butyricum E4 str. BoNT E BL5262 TaxID=632245 RepID=C4IE78_CLOBU|nr:aminoacyl-histidine dipeptidase [Clostridium butyricum]APF25052.1 Xaa-His dipeptidase family protein [Clostridium butyricum]EDT73876.1 aminoacyl-histidine dipeptidase [Clostridium butyricum 5521]EEP55716.1 aminoacyl-histidine dipeptidase [Clostridium butyricum E4 str. BoNT E BL5262]NFL32184.1 aminoacyl-histidine dipeptidase [Clostridium butyricum]NFS19895.1 aminoacyl-histidine dipeptidase [Clostridium butyricum]
MKKIENVKFDRIFYHFEQISKIPRGSGNEKAISDYLLDFGKSLGLECIQDAALNIIIKKPASIGYENAPAVIIQGHMDMVCEKNSDKEHDFEKDPINLVVKGDYIYADRTTLGADDGIAVAYAMTLLEDNTIEHPAIEVLLTTDEEAGMSGAMALQPHYINGKIVLNLDSEEEGKLLVSCAGGIRTKSILPIEWIDKKNDTIAYNIVIRGLKGGHSGMEIHLGRGNSNKLMGRLLKNIDKELDFNLVSLNGGSKNNAIPRESSSIITISQKDERKLLDIKRRVFEELKNEFSKKDPNLRVHLLEVEESVDKVFSDDSTKKAVDLLYMYPNGVNTVSSDIQGLTESSTNLGVVTTLENSIEYDSTARSSISSLKDEIVTRSKCITEILGGKLVTESSYPEWPYKTDSKIREVCKDVYERMYEKTSEIVAIHAGVECGLFKEKLGNDVDMISFGPDIIDIHTPNEHISISSVERCYEYLLEVLKEIK